MGLLKSPGRMVLQKIMNFFLRILHLIFKDLILKTSHQGHTLSTSRGLDLICYNEWIEINCSKKY